MASTYVAGAGTDWRGVSDMREVLFVAVHESVPGHKADLMQRLHMHSCPLLDRSGLSPVMTSSAGVYLSFCVPTQPFCEMSKITPSGSLNLRSKFSFSASFPRSKKKVPPLASMRCCVSSRSST